MPPKKQVDTGLAIATHILGIVTGFIGPLIIYFVAKDDFSKNNARTALNWQFSALIYMAVSFVLMLVLMLVLIGFVTFAIVWVLDIIFGIMAAVKASKSETWKYPLSIPFFKVA